jgi:hypothetical protein
VHLACRATTASVSRRVVRSSRRTAPRLASPGTRSTLQQLLTTTRGSSTTNRQTRDATSQGPSARYSRAGYPEVRPPVLLLPAPDAGPTRDEPEGNDRATSTPTTGTYSKRHRCRRAPTPKTSDCASCASWRRHQGQAALGRSNTVRQRTSSLIVPGGALVQRQVEGSALDVLNEVLTWESPS